METVSLLGFLTVIDHPRSGFVGGLLVLNPVGRPVEFHCTASLKPNRAQEILFGSALEPYLLGEQIAQALVRKSQANIGFLFTDLPGVLALQDFIEQPIIYIPKPDSDSNAVSEHFESGKKNDLFSHSVRQAETQTETQVETRSERYQPLRSISGLSVSRWKETRIADLPLWIPDDRGMDIYAISEKLTDYTRSVNFSEPFTRIRLALDEALKN